MLTQHAVAVRDGKIEAVLPTAEATTRFAAYERIELAQHALIPGLINVHTHAAMTLMRGLADDLPLMSWLQDHIWPAEKRHVVFDAGHDPLPRSQMIREILAWLDKYMGPVS